MKMFKNGGRPRSQWTAAFAPMPLCASERTHFSCTQTARYI